MSIYDASVMRRKIGSLENSIQLEGQRPKLTSMKNRSVLTCGVMVC